MDKEIIRLLDENQADFGRLYELYSGVKKVFINKSDNLKTGFIGNALDKERLENDIDYCVKNYARNTKDKSKWLKRADILIELNGLTPTKYYTQIVFKDIAIKIQNIMNLDDGLGVHDAPTTINIDLSSYDIPEAVIKYGVLSNKQVKGGIFINNHFIPDNIIGYLESETIKKLPKKQKELLPKNQELKINVNLQTILDKFIKYECDKQGYMPETVQKWIKDVGRLIKYMEDNKIYEIEKLDTEEFQDYISTEKYKNGKTISKKTVNNVIGRLRKFFDYAVLKRHISNNPFEKLSNYRIDKNITDKRNFTPDELKDLFSGKHGICKEILDCLRFLLLTGIRTEEFYNLNKNSFYTTCNQPFLRVKTAKQGVTKEIYRNIPLSPLLKDLSKYSWIANLKKIYSSKGSLSKTLNAQIDKVIKDNDVSVHRLRGNFASAIDEYLIAIGFQEYIETTKDLLGHAKKIAKHKTGEQVKHKLTKGMLGSAPDMTSGTYVKSEYKDSKIKAIAGLYVFKDIFKYLELPKDQIGQRARRKTKKVSVKPMV